MTGPSEPLPDPDPKNAYQETKTPIFLNLASSLTQNFYQDRNLPQPCPEVAPKSPAKTGTFHNLARNFPELGDQEAAPEHTGACLI